MDVAREEKGIKSLIAALGFERTGFGRPIPLPGGFAGLVEFGDWALVLCTDGVGSKVEIAHALKKYDTVGIDCIAMNVNDCVCVGGEPLAFVDYLAMEKPDKATMAEIGKGLGTGAQESNVSVIGGETASLPDLVNGFDLAGTCMGAVKKDKVLDGRRVQEGDVILGLPSHGLHSNGYTLVRKLAAKHRLSWGAKAPFAKGASLGEALLEPTKIYVKPALRLLQSGLDVKAFAHVTGGGLQNLPRMNRKFRYLIEEPLDPQPVYAWLRELGGLDPVEMYKTFNMGMGFAVVVAKGDADAALDLLTREMDAGLQPLHDANMGEAPRVVGRVTRGEGCLLEPLRATYESKT